MADKPIDEWQEDILVVPDLTRISQHDGKYEQKWVKKLPRECRFCHDKGEMILEAELPPRPKGIDLDVVRHPEIPEWDEVRPPPNWVSILVSPSMHYPAAMANSLLQGKSLWLACGEYEQKYHRQWVEWSCARDKCAFKIFAIQLAEARIITQKEDGKLSLRERLRNFVFYLKMAFNSIR